MTASSRCRTTRRWAPLMRTMPGSASGRARGAEQDGFIALPADAPVGAAYADYAGLDDPVIDVSVTPNRQDAMGVYGIARDLAAAGLGRLTPVEAPETPGAFPCPVEIRT